MRPGRGEDGMATAEMAVALPSLVAVVLLACGLVATCQASLRCEDAARLAARSAARGDAPATVTALARSDAPAGSAVAVSRTAGEVRVGVTTTVRLPGPLGRMLPAWSVSGAATALDEVSGAEPDG